MGLSQNNTLQLDCCAVDSLFKEDIYIKANPEMKKTISLAFMIDFLNDKFHKCEQNHPVLLPDLHSPSLFALRKRL